MTVYVKMADNLQDSTENPENRVVIQTHIYLEPNRTSIIELFCKIK